MAFEFIVPKQIISGKGALEKSNLKFGKKALIVTDPMMVQLGNVKLVQDRLSKQDIVSVVYDEIVNEPTDVMIEKGALLYKDNNCDFLVAIGGGSPIDSMKAIGAVVAGSKNINDYLHKEITEIPCSMVAIPTTAGTGSEATQFTIITNTKEDIKMLLKGKALIPDLAIIDPYFTLTAPKSVTAATGLDALCHALESYTSRKAQPLSKTFSVSAIKRILKYLPQVYANGKNVEAREQMAVASLEAGIAFNNSSVTIIHGMSRPIGALYHIAHGLSNAILLKECMKFALEGAYDTFGELSKEVGVSSKCTDNVIASSELFKVIEELINICEIPTLSKLNVSKDDFVNNIPKMSKDAMDSGSCSNTLRDCSIEDVQKIYHKIIEI